MLTEWNFDGLVGPTHNYAGLSEGNLASTSNEGRVSNPQAAALQGLAKMRFVAGLGVPQAMLPPHPRPHVPTLRGLGFRGTDEEVIADAWRENEQLLRQCSSASAMWTANAATVAPSSDTEDERLHLTPANLSAMFHRAIEAPTTTRVLQSIFANESLFAVHEALPGAFGDEGAANHTRLRTEEGVVHLFAWGGEALSAQGASTRFPARQAKEASSSVARLHRLDPQRTVFARQHPAGIDAGAFHTDVLAVGTGRFLMCHALAFQDLDALTETLRRLLGDSFSLVVATDEELPVADAIGSYPFNSQLVTLSDGSVHVVAPVESQDNERARSFFDRVIASDNPVSEVHYLDVRESMNNGGGPACLRLRVPMTVQESRALGARVALDDALHRDLKRWVGKHYRDRLHPADLGDPMLWREQQQALDELTGLLRLGSVYDFQR